MMKIATLLLMVAAYSAKAEDWYNFKTHFSINVFTGFFNQPRTTEDATSDGWISMSGDCQTGMFNGNRFAHPDRPEFTLIYDKNSYIAGIQSIVPKSKTSNDMYFPFS